MWKSGWNVSREYQWLDIKWKKNQRNMESHSWKFQSSFPTSFCCNIWYLIKGFFSKKLFIKLNCMIRSKSAYCKNWAVTFWFVIRISSTKFCFLTSTDELNDNLNIAAASKKRNFKISLEWACFSKGSITFCFHTAALLTKTLSPGSHFF